jgi:hypothetical protein
MATPYTRSITEDQRAILAGLSEPMSYMDLRAKFVRADGTYQFEGRRVLGVLKALADRGLVDFKRVPKAKGLWSRNDAGQRVLDKYDNPAYRSMTS